MTTPSEPVLGTGLFLPQPPAMSADDWRQVTEELLDLYRSHRDKPDGGTPSWPGAYRAVAATLRERRRHAQVDVIEAAARNGGYIARDRVYAITGYDEGRTLRGFTVPVENVCNELKAAGKLASDAPTLLETFYADPSGRPQSAAGFVVPDEIVTLFGSTPNNRPPQRGTDAQRNRPWPEDLSIEGFTTDRSRNVHLDESCVKYQHSLDVARQRGRQIHPVRRLTLREAKAEDKGICSYCFRHLV